jgi:phosphoglycerate dehydrogenase-like enzyme
MRITLLQAKLSEDEINRLPDEFPQFLFLSFNEMTYKNLSKDDWEKVEILYGSKLTEEELAKAPELRWIHCPVPNLSGLCTDAIQESGRIMLTTSWEENTDQIGEYVMAGVLAFAKNLLHWKDLNAHPEHIWDSKWRESMWEMKNRVLLQVGLGQIGNEVVRRAKMMDMKVWAVHDRHTFHPLCDRVFTWEELNKVLPEADVISISLPRNMQKRKVLTPEVLGLIKKEVILTILGGKELFDEQGLIKAVREGKFRGVLWDALYQKPLSPASELWGLPNMIITPEASPRPKSREGESLKLFRYNFRQYIHDNFTDMRNLVRLNKN